MNSSNIELDEFDEMAFGLGPPQTSSTSATGREFGDDPMQFLNSRAPPPLRIPPKSPAQTTSTKIPMDGLFSDEEEDDIFPVVSRPKTAAPPSRNSDRDIISGKESVLSSELNRKIDQPSSSSSRPNTGSILDRLTQTTPTTIPPAEVKTPGSSGVSGFDVPGRQGFFGGRPTTAAGGRQMNATATESSSLGVKAPVKSSLFKNLVAPSWEKTQSTQQMELPAQVSLPAQIATSTIDKAESERQRRAMIFGGSSAVIPTPATSSPAIPNSVTGTDSDDLVKKVLEETKHAEEEDHRRVSSHHEFIRQQTQQAVQLQQTQANEFLKQYLAENRKQLDSHLTRLRSAFPLTSTDSAEPDTNSNPKNTLLLEKKIEILEKRLDNRDNQLAEYSALLITLEDQHRDEVRELRSLHDESVQRTAQSHHDYVISLLGNQESVRKQYEEALGNLRDAVSAKSSLEVVRGTVEQSAREFTVWRTELEQKHEMVLREKDSALQTKETQINELTNMIERQTEKSRIEREMLLLRIQEESGHLLKRQTEIDEQNFVLQREKLELESERKSFHNQQTKELQRLEKRMEETLRERQTVLESLTEEKHAIEEEKRKISETIRAVEEKYALEYKKRQMNLDSDIDSLAGEKRQWDEKHRKLDREVDALKDERGRLEKEKKELSDRKSQLDKYNEDLQKRDLELEQTALRVAKIKRDGELALHEAKFMDEEHKTRVAKFNVFLEQLRDKELNLMRQAVMDSDGGQQQQRAAIQMPNGSLAGVPQRSARGTRVQLIPNPAKDLRQWKDERDYVQVLKSTPWNTKKT